MIEGPTVVVVVHMSGIQERKRVVYDTVHLSYKRAVLFFETIHQVHEGLLEYGVCNCTRFGVVDRGSGACANEPRERPEPARHRRVELCRLISKVRLKMGSIIDLNDVPHRVQYITIDSVDLKTYTGNEAVQSRHNPVTLDIDMKSNIHVEGMSEVIGLKVVDAYFMQFGGDGTRDSGVARFVDIVCPQVPTCAQLLTTRGHVLARCPLERATATNDDVTFDKQAKLMTRKTNYFNPISIKKLDFSFFELGGDDGYHVIPNSREWTITLEVTTIDAKEKPVNKDQRILDAMTALLAKIDQLNLNVAKLPEREDAEKKKLPFSALVAVIAGIFALYATWIGRANARAAQAAVPMY